MKKLLCAALAAAMLLSLAACGGNGESSDGPGSSGADSASSTGSSPKGESRRRMSRMTVYGPNDEVYYWHEYEYGPDGKMKSVTSYSPFGHENGHVDFVYDNQGNRLVDYMIHGVGRSRSNGILQPPELNEETGSVSKREKEYDSEGHVIRELWHQSDGMVFSEKYEYEYDGAGKTVNKKRLLKMEGSEDYSDYYEIEYYEYDSNENLITVDCFLHPGGESDIEERHRTTEYEYDSEGRVVRSNFYSGTEKVLNSYSETEYTDSGEFLKNCQYEKDSSGNMTLKSYTDYYNDNQGYSTGYSEYEICDGVEILAERVEYTYE